MELDKRIAQLRRAQNMTQQQLVNALRIAQQTLAHYEVARCLTDMSAFVERSRLLREARQITQTRLASLLEVAPRVHNRWERGTATPQFDTVARIADILQVSLDELAGRSASITDPKIHNTELSK